MMSPRDTDRLLRGRIQTVATGPEYSNQFPFEQVHAAMPTAIDPEAGSPAVAGGLIRVLHRRAVRQLPTDLKHGYNNF